MLTNKVKVGNTVFGEGRPKLCIPIVGHTFEDIINQASHILTLTPDIAEWRVDMFENHTDFDDVNKVLTALRTTLKDIPVLFTFRTANEGGNASITFDNYKKLLINVSKTTLVDLIDVEIHASTIIDIIPLIKAIKENVPVIASFHDFEKTPDRGAIIDCLSYMAKCGADICKIACMPNSMKDVFTLMAATDGASNILPQPLVTMSMKEMGLMSRICGECYGSAMTFGAAGITSAPGQIDATQLKTMLDILHSNYTNQ